MKRNYKENQNLIEFMEMISATLTPDFSTEDWLNLIDRAMEGDSISLEILYHLWETKVNPFLPPELQSKEGHPFRKEGGVQ